MKKEPGKIAIISSPSGGGKTTICKKLLTPTRKKQSWQFSLSYTTRKKRASEKNGREYFFVSDDEFKNLVKKNFFAEHCLVHRYRYGTPRKPLEKVIKSGGVMILDVDYQGALKIKKAFPHAITIFILPPSISDLKKRLIRRGTETKEQLKIRFENAKKEIRQYSKFEYLVINKQLDKAVKEVLCIINSYHCRIENANKEQIRKLLV